MSHQYSANTGHKLVTEAIEAVWAKMSEAERGILTDCFAPLVAGVNRLGEKGTVELMGRLGLAFLMLQRGHRADASLRNCLDELGVNASCSEVME